MAIFDPNEPRDKNGRWTRGAAVKALVRKMKETPVGDSMRQGEDIHIGRGTGVKIRTLPGATYDRVKGGGGPERDHTSRESAARDALDRSARQTHKNSLGGPTSHRDSVAFQASDAQRQYAQHKKSAGYAHGAAQGVSQPSRKSDMGGIKKIKGTAHAPYVNRYLKGKPGEPGARAVNIQQRSLGTWEGVLLDTSKDPIGRVIHREDLPMKHFSVSEADQHARRLLRKKGTR